MTDFPSLSKNSNRINFKQSLAVDPSLISKFENGAMQSRTKYSNVSLKFEFNYSFLNRSDKVLLEDFEKSVGYKGGSFNWENLADNKTYIVRFDNNLSFIQETMEDFWKVAIKLVEIRPNTSVNVS